MSQLPISINIENLRDQKTNRYPANFIEMMDKINQQHLLGWFDRLRIKMGFDGQGLEIAGIVS